MLLLLRRVKEKVKYHRNYFKGFWWERSKVEIEGQKKTIWCNVLLQDRLIFCIGNTFGSKTRRTDNQNTFAPLGNWYFLYAGRQGHCILSRLLPALLDSKTVDKLEDTFHPIFTFSDKKTNKLWLIMLTWNAVKLAITNSSRAAIFVRYNWGSLLTGIFVYLNNQLDLEFCSL